MIKRSFRSRRQEHQMMGLVQECRMPSVIHFFFSCRLLAHFSNSDGRRALLFSLSFPSLYTFCSLSTMGIVHTVKSRIELWRLERYTKRRSCQLPGYKGKYGFMGNRRSSAHSSQGMCLSVIERELTSGFKNMMKGRKDFKCSETYNTSSLWE